MFDDKEKKSLSKEKKRSTIIYFLIKIERLIPPISFLSEIVCTKSLFWKEKTNIVNSRINFSKKSFWERESRIWFSKLALEHFSTIYNNLSTIKIFSIEIYKIYFTIFLKKIKKTAHLSNFYKNIDLKKKNVLAQIWKSTRSKSI